MESHSPLSLAAVREKLTEDGQIHVAHSPWLTHIGFSFLSPGVGGHMCGYCPNSTERAPESR